MAGRARYRSRTPARVAAVVVVVAAVAGGLLVGRWTAPPAPAPGLPGGPASGPGAVAVPPFVRSPEGALAAAAWYVVGVYGSSGQPADRVRSRFAALVSGPAALDRVVAVSGTDFDGDPVPAGSTCRAAVVGVRQVSYLPEVARVAVWWVLVCTSGTGGTGGAGGGPWQRWLDDVLSLEWDRGWKFAGTDTLVGSMPPPHTRQAPNVVGTNVQLAGLPGQRFGAVPDGR